MSVFDVGSLILLFAALLGAVNDRFLGLPRVIVYLIGSLALSLCLILAGRLYFGPHLGEALQRRVEGAHLPKILLDGVLALLLFAASLQIDLRELRSRAFGILALATLGVLLATALFTVAIWGAFAIAGDPIPMPWCFVLGAILAPTDAIAVEGLLKRVALPSALKALISGESLFNDGTAVVVFVAALAVAAGEHNVIGHGRLLMAIVTEGGGGAVLGLATGFVAAWLLRRIRDDAVAVTMSLALALGTYRLAAALDLSGPIGVVVAGLVMAARPIAPDAETSRRSRLGAFLVAHRRIVEHAVVLVDGLSGVRDPARRFRPVSRVRRDSAGAAGPPAERGADDAVRQAGAGPEDARAGASDMGRLARRRIGRFGAQPARYAFPRAAVGGLLRRRHLHRRGAGALDAAHGEGAVSATEAGMTIRASRRRASRKKR